MSFGPAAAAPLIIARNGEQCVVYLCLCILYLITPALFSTNIYTFCLDTKDFWIQEFFKFDIDIAMNTQGEKGPQSVFTMFHM